MESELEGYLDVEERQGQKIQRDNLKRLSKEMLRHGRVFAFGCLMLLIATAAALIEPRLFGYAIDEAIVPQTLGLSAHPHDHCIFWSFAFARAMTIANMYLFELLGQRVTQDLRCRLFSHLQRLPITVYRQEPCRASAHARDERHRIAWGNVHRRIRFDDRKRDHGAGDPDLADRPRCEAGFDRGKRHADPDRVVDPFQFEASRFLPRGTKQTVGPQCISRRESSRDESGASLQSPEAASRAL